jgi:hypothetical protein
MRLDGDLILGTVASQPLQADLMVCAKIFQIHVSQSPNPLDSFFRGQFSHIMQWAKGGVAVVMGESHGQILHFC